MRVAVFGGSFNPPHVGHVLAVAYVLSAIDVDRVLVVPVFQHPFLKELAPFDDRVNMCELALGWLRNADVTRVEEALESPSLTIRTLERLATDHSEWQLRLVVGADVLEDAADWHAWDEVVQKAPLIVLGRQGVDRADAPAPQLPDVSSTRVRELLRARDSNDARRELERLVPRAVMQYIEKRGLYR